MLRKPFDRKRRASGFKFKFKHFIQTKEKKKQIAEIQSTATKFGFYGDTFFFFFWKEEQDFG